MQEAVSVLTGTSVQCDLQHKIEIPSVAVQLLVEATRSCVLTLTKKIFYHRLCLILRVLSCLQRRIMR